MWNKLRKLVLKELQTYKVSKINREQLAPDKFILHVTFDGIIVPGKNMTINQLAKIVNDLAVTVNELSVTVDGLSKTVNELSTTMKQEFAKVNKRLDEHSEIFKRNNLK